MCEQLRPALVVLATLTGLTGIVYPSLVTAFAQVAFRHQANGSLIQHGGQPWARADWASVYEARVLLGAALGDRAVPVQCGGCLRLELWTSPPGIASCGAGPHPGAEKISRPDVRRPCRLGDFLGQRSRSAR